MAKVDTLSFEIEGATYSSNINVGKKGVFSIKLDWQVSEALGLPDTIISKVLDELTSQIGEKYHAYKESATFEETFIWIRYASNGWYNENSDGHTLHHDSQYKITGFYGDTSKLAFEFGVVIRKSTNGVVTWFETQKGQGCVQFGQADQTDPNVYYKQRQRESVDGKLIPYSREAFTTLTKAKEGIRQISEILYDFIDRDPSEIEKSLLGGVLQVGNEFLLPKSNS